MIVDTNVDYSKQNKKKVSSNKSTENFRKKKKEKLDIK